MGSDAKANGGSGGGFRAKLDHVLYSGDKKHVLGGLAVITVIFGIPWYFMNRGTPLNLSQNHLSMSFPLL